MIICGRTKIIGITDVITDDKILNISEKIFDILTIGVRFRILMSFHFDEPALSRLVSENAPAMLTSCPLDLKYCAKNDNLVQAAWG